MTADRATIRRDAGLRRPFRLRQLCRLLKVLILVGAAGALLLAGDFLRDERIERYEYPLLVLFSAARHVHDGLGQQPARRCIMALELQSLPIYVLAAIPPRPACARPRPG